MGLGRRQKKEKMNEQKNKRERRKFDEAFRRDAVAIVESTGRPMSEIARELGVTYWNLRDWVKLYGRSRRGKVAATSAEMEKEMQCLKRENESLRAQREVLKKALGIVAEPNRNASLE